MLSRSLLTQTAVLIRTVAETEKYRRPITETEAQPSSKYGKTITIPEETEPPFTTSDLKGVVIPCRREGYNRYYPSNNILRDFHDFKYIVIDEVKVNDRLDGQVVIGVHEVVDFRGRLSHYEVQVGNFKD